MNYQQKYLKYKSKYLQIKYGHNKIFSYSYKVNYDNNDLDYKKKYLKYKSKYLYIKYGGVDTAMAAKIALTGAKLVPHSPVAAKIALTGAKLFAPPPVTFGLMLADKVAHSSAGKLLAANVTNAATGALAGKAQKFADMAVSQAPSLEKAKEKAKKLASIVVSQANVKGEEAKKLASIAVSSAANKLGQATKK